MVSLELCWNSSGISHLKEVSWLFGREVKAYEDQFDARSYDAMLILDLNLIKVNFPETFDLDQRG
jgi:hypothetical protein